MHDLNKGCEFASHFIDIVMKNDTSHLLF